MSQYDAKINLNINVSHSYLYKNYFMVHLFCFISLRVFHGCMSNFGIMSQCDAVTDFIINVGHIDLYFRVQLFCFKSGKVFYGWMSYF